MTEVLGLAPTVAALVALASLLGGLVRGFAGFGASLMFMPIAAAVLGPKIAVATVFAVDAVLQLPFVLRQWRHARVAEVWLLVVGNLFGLPAGLALLLWLDPVLVRWVLSGVTLFYITLLATGFRLTKPPGKPATVAVGLGSGFLSGLAGLGGTVVGLFWLSGQAKSDAIRASVVAFGAIITVTTGIAYAGAGLFNASILGPAMICAPFYGLGMYLGAVAFRRVDERVFRLLTYVVIGISALVSLPVLDSWLGR